MNVIDYSKQFKKSNNICGNHSPIFPKNIFCVMAGSTGSGKTNLMIQYLKEYYEPLENLIKDKTGKVVKIYHFFDADEEIVDPSMLDKNKSHIMIFDDVMLKDQTLIKEYFC